jgi:hypothetical protein
MATDALEAVGAEFVVESYSGDDWAQVLARNFWFVMLAMGGMLVAGALAAASASGVSLGHFFAVGAAAADSYGRAQSTMAWATGVNFLGMGFILSGITMVLVNIVRTLRDSGADVQGSLRAEETLQLRKPIEGQLAPYVMMLGLMILGAGLAFGAVVATKLGAIPAPLLVKGGSALAGDNLAGFGSAQAIGTWIGPVRFAGLATIFGSIVLALRVIIKTLRYQAFRVTELVATGHVPTRSKGHARRVSVSTGSRKVSTRRRSSTRTRAA